MEIVFEFTLPNGPKSPIVIVSGGADANRDGQIENASEVGAFTREPNNMWTRKQQVVGPTDGMLFAVTFTVGPGVAWNLRISDANKRTLYTGANTTMFPSETVSYYLT